MIASEGGTVSWAEVTACAKVLKQEGMSHIWTEHQDSRCTENKGKTGQDE